MDSRLAAKLFDPQRHNSFTPGEDMRTGRVVHRPLWLQLPDIPGELILFILIPHRQEIGSNRHLYKE